MEDSTKKNLNLWLTSQKQERENLFMRKRLLPVSPTEKKNENCLTDDELKVLTKYLQKPTSPECELALKRFKSAFLHYPSILPAKFVKIPNALQNFVGIFTNLSIDINLQLLAANCLTTLSMATNSKVAEQLLKLAGSYLTQYLKSNNHKLVLSCVLTLCNLTIEPTVKTMKMLFALGTEHYLVELVDIMYDVRIREAALFALLHLLINSKDNHLAQNVLLQKRFLQQLFNNISERNSPVTYEVQLYSIWILFYLSVVDEFNIEMSDATVLINRLENAISLDVWQLNIIFPLVRILALLFSRPFLFGENGNDFISRIIIVSIKLLRSDYISLRKETLWLLTNLATEAPNNSCFGDEVIVKEVIKIATLSMSEDILNLVLTFLLNCVMRRFLGKEECRQTLNTIFSANVLLPDNLRTAYHDLLTIICD